MSQTRIHLCGRLVARIDGARVEGLLPGRQGRTVFALLVLERRGVVTRAALAHAVWDGRPPDAAETALSALLSKLRRTVPVEGRSELRVVLPAAAWIDVEVAAAALHRAESAIARRDWAAAWGPARVAQHILERPFLAGDSGRWAERERLRLARDLERALELAGRACLEIGGSELDTAERTARRLVEVSPLRESGTRLLMEVCGRRGNRADALLAYELLRARLRDELGVTPSADTVALHRALVA